MSDDWFLVQQGTRLSPRVFNPLTDQRLKLWFKANDANTITSSGGAISQWNDKSSSGVTATQATGSQQPTIVVGGQNGKNTVRFTAANFQLLNFNVSVTAASTYTLFTVFKRSAIGTTAIILGNSALANYGVAYYLDNNIYSSNASGYISGAPAIPSDATYNLITVRFNTGTSGTIRFNRALITSAFTMSVNSGVFNNLGDDLNLGLSDATLAEVMLFNGVLTDDEVGYTENYLYGEWSTP